MPTLHAIILGILEGLTEFLPVSSTGHLVLADHFLGLQSSGTFKVLIQLGAILAIVTVYFGKLLRILLDLPSTRKTQLFVLSVLLAFLPAAAIGATFHKLIKSVLLESPLVVCVSLVVGGLVLLVVDRMRFEVKYRDVMDIPPAKALIIGFFQCLALVPGVSRSGSSIVGAMLLGVDKQRAAEFSFFLAMPTMTGAFAYDLYKSYGDLDLTQATSIGIGFVTSCIAGALVVRYLLAFVGNHGFAPFAWWRIVVGGIGLGALLMNQAL
ncbi:MAG: undecaprenyl-diphosphate phosphatase [Hyphomicrobiaceae bacterium]